MTDELDRLERRVQEVRGQLARDLDELFLRLQPRRMVRSVGVQARSPHASGDVGRDVVRDMRHNPIPYLLVGIGIAGLVWAISSVSRIRTQARLPEFSEADFVPPPSPRAAGTPPGGPAGPLTATASPLSASDAPMREISPADAAER
jgi:hypothetical protein